MSVEKIAALTQATTDAATMRALNGPGVGHGRAPAPFPPPTAPATPEGAPNPFDSLALPFPTSTAADLPTSLIAASYRTEATRGALELLVEGRLPETLIRREVETLLRRLVATRERDEAEETTPERLPSHNAADSHFDVKSRLAATDEDGRLKLFDLYLTRIGPRQWEAAIFERDPSRASQTFPRPTPPVDVYRLLFDPTAAAVLACVAQKVPTPVAPTPPRGGERRIAYAILAAALSLLVARVASWPAAGFLLAAAGVLLLSKS
jgi:hypothetical protein